MYIKLFIESLKNNKNITFITMATITVRVSDELKNTMDSLDEVNWSAVTRNFLEEKVKELYIRDRLSKAEKQIKEGKTLSHDEVKNMFLKK